MRAGHEYEHPVYEAVPAAPRGAVRLTLSVLPPRVRPSGDKFAVMTACAGFRLATTVPWIEPLIGTRAGFLVLLLVAVAITDADPLECVWRTQRPRAHQASPRSRWRRLSVGCAVPPSEACDAGDVALVWPVGHGAAPNAPVRSPFTT